MRTIALRLPPGIVAPTGTLSRDGGLLHLAFADHQGRTVGGQLAEGRTVRTTPEAVRPTLPLLRRGDAAWLPAGGRPGDQLEAELPGPLLELEVELPG